MLIIKKSNFILLLLAVAALSSLFVVSCHNGIPKGPGANQVLITIPEDHSGLDKINHFITDDSIKYLRSNFDRQAEKFSSIKVHVPNSEAFNKRALLSLLKADDCVGIRIYQGAKISSKTGQAELRLVLVGVDSKGNDILIDRTSVLAAKVMSDEGGLEQGQCPNCLTDF